MDPAEFANVARLEESHWRYVGARELVAGQVAAVAGGSALTVLDAGCGTGRTIAELGTHRTFGLDLAFEALRLARARTRGLVRAGVCEIPYPDQAFDVVISQDVLYHLGVASDAQALEEFRRVLRPKGTLLLMLPAFASLRGAHDVVTHARARYRRREVGEKLEAAGFAVRSLSYWNSLLFPFAAAFRLAQRVGGGPARSDVRPLPVAINRLLIGALRLENRWLARGGRLPFGLSVFAVAERRGSW